MSSRSSTTTTLTTVSGARFTVARPRNELVHTAPKVQTRSFGEWKTMFEEIANFVETDMYPSTHIRNVKRTVVNAPVKCGKRFMVQAYASYTTPIKPTDTRTANIFVSSFVRTDDKKQRNELMEYLQGVYSINSKKRVQACIKELEGMLREYDRIIVHHDELDYGSGHTQHMAKIYEFCMCHSKIQMIQYSASAEEGIIQPLTADDVDIPHVITFNPPSGYRGAEWYLAKNLVYDAKPFFQTTTDGIIVTEQGKEILELARQNLASDDPIVQNRRLVIVRETEFLPMVKDAKMAKQIPEFIYDRARNKIQVHFVHSRKEVGTASIEWDNYNFWEMFMNEENDGKIVVIVIDKSSSRSTDWFCHPWVAAYHDYHSDNSFVNTIIQSNLRVSFYTNKKYNGEDVYKGQEFPIRLYGCKKIMEYVAGRLPLDELDRGMSARSRTFPVIHTFSLPYRIMLSAEDLEMYREDIECRLNAESKERLSELLKTYIEDVDVRQALTDRELKGKRRYTGQRAQPEGEEGEDEEINVVQGGITTVATNYIKKIPSRPGGGCVNDDYDLRDEFWFVDIALNDITFTFDGKQHVIPKGTAYIVWGIKDGSEEDIFDDDDSVESESTTTFVPDRTKQYAHRSTGKSMYAHKK